MSFLESVVKAIVRFVLVVFGLFVILVFAVVVYDIRTRCPECNAGICVSCAHRPPNRPAPYPLSPFGENGVTRPVPTPIPTPAPAPQPATSASSRSHTVEPKVESLRIIENPETSKEAPCRD